VNIENNETHGINLFSEDPDYFHKQINELNDKLEAEKDHRREERLLWIIISVILLNITFFTSMESILGPIVIGLLQLIVLTVVAKRLGLEESIRIINRLVGFVANVSKQ